MQPKLKLLTKLRVKAIEILAQWLNVPAEINRHHLSEVQEETVHLYIKDCVTVGKQVFGMGGDELAEMCNHLTKFHMDNMDNPFNLHDGAFIRVCGWRGIHQGNDPRMLEYNEKYQRAIDSGMNINFF